MYNCRPTDRSIGRSFHSKSVGDLDLEMRLCMYVCMYVCMYGQASLLEKKRKEEKRREKKRKENGPPA